MEMENCVECELLRLVYFWSGYLGFNYLKYGCYEDMMNDILIVSFYLIQCGKFLKKVYVCMGKTCGYTFHFRVKIELFFFRVVYVTGLIVARFCQQLFIGSTTSFLSV